MGFFSKQQIQSIERPDGKQLSCNSCGLYKDVRNPKMKPFGNFKKGIMCIGEYPREVEDMRGKAWQGKDGSLLRKTLLDFGIDLFDDCINLYALGCQPKDDEGKTRNADNHEISCCRRFVLAAIKEYKPSIIIVLGKSALQSVIGARWKKDWGEFTKWVGNLIPDQDLKAWICPVFSPYYVHTEEKEEVENVWRGQLENALRMQHVPFPIYKQPNITLLYKAEDLKVLSTIKNCSTIAFDYETTGLKPHAEGHKIVCASVATDEDNVYAFMMPKQRSLRQPLIQLLENDTIGKMAHNMKFEKTWTYYRLNNTIVENWQWDSMLAAHLLDNRAGVTGLKFQTYVKFGLIDYSSEIEPWLQADEKNSNSFNRLEEFVASKENAKKVLTYCALDSVLEYRLAMLQKKEMGLLQLPF